MPVERGHYSLLWAICASLFCTPLMVAGVNAVLPEIGGTLQAGATQLGLVGTTYSLGLAVFQLACGSFGDICGHRNVFLWGAGLFGIVTILLGFTDSINLFLILRFFQGVGGAMLSASGLALLASSARPENRTLYLGFSSAAVYSGIACGPPIAGFIAGALGWRCIFWLNALTSLGIFLLMYFGVNHDWRPAGDKKFDWQGCLFYGIAMAALTMGASQFTQSALAGIICLGIFAITLALFLWRELHCAFPMLNILFVFKNRVMALSSLAAFVNYASFFGIVFYFSFYIQVAKGKSVQETGLILAIQAVAQALSTPFATRLCQKWSPGKTSALGAALCGFGLLASAFMDLHSPLRILIIAQVLLGVGICLFSLANTNILLESAGMAQVGQASGMVGAMRTGGQLCSMIFMTLSLSLFLGNEPISLANMDGFLGSMRLDLVIFGILNILAIGMSLARNRI